MSHKPTDAALRMPKTRDRQGNPNYVLEVSVAKWYRLKGEVWQKREENRRLRAQLRIEKVLNDALRSELEQAVIR